MHFRCLVSHLFPASRSRSPVQERLQLITQEVRDGKKTLGASEECCCATCPNVRRAVTEAFSILSYSDSLVVWVKMRRGFLQPALMFYQICTS